MTTYTLRPISASLWHITSERKKVGHVTTCPKGFVARLGQRCEVRASAQAAFEAVVVPTLGFATKAELLASNAAARRRNAMVRNAAHHIAGEFLRGNSAPILDLLDKAMKHV
jgi:hypothetical protein